MVRPILDVEVVHPRLTQESLPLDHHEGTSPQVLRKNGAARLIDRRFPHELHEYDEATRLRDTYELSHRIRGLAVVCEADLADGDVEHLIAIGKRIRAAGLKLQSVVHTVLPTPHLRRLDHRGIDIDPRRGRTEFADKILGRNALARRHIEHLVHFGHPREKRNLSIQLHSSRREEPPRTQADEIEHGRNRGNGRPRTDRVRWHGGER